MGIINTILSFFFPPRCALCGKIMFEQEARVCKECLLGLPLTYSKPVFPIGEKRVGRKKVYFFCVLSPFYYINSVRTGILALKFYGRQKTAQFLGSYMADAVKHSPFYSECEFIISVPASRKRKNKRGYNQCELLALEVSKAIKKPLCKQGVLVRKRDAKAQSLAKDKHERSKNVKNAFIIVNNQDIKDKIILLVDDIITTGETLNECSRVLLEAGAKKVLCVTAAKAKPRKN